MASNYITAAGAVDEFIEATRPRIGETFRRGDLAAWFVKTGIAYDPGVALTAHRRSPRTRLWTTERVGMGMYSYYRVVAHHEQDNVAIDRNSVQRMHRQQAEEMVDRWAAEYTHRMSPVAVHSKRTAKVIRRAKHEVAAVATLMGVRLEGLDDD